MIEIPTGEVLNLAVQSLIQIAGMLAGAIGAHPLEAIAWAMLGVVGRAAISPRSQRV